MTKGSTPEGLKWLICSCRARKPYRGAQATRHRTLFVAKDPKNHTPIDTFYLCPCQKGQYYLNPLPNNAEIEAFAQQHKSCAEHFAKQPAKQRAMEAYRIFGDLRTAEFIRRRATLRREKVLEVERCASRLRTHEVDLDASPSLEEAREPREKVSEVSEVREVTEEATKEEEVDEDEEDVMLMEEEEEGEVLRAEEEKAVECDLEATSKSAKFLMTWLKASDQAESGEDMERMLRRLNGEASVREEEAREEPTTSRLLMGENDSLMDIFDPPTPTPLCEDLSTPTPLCEDVYLDASEEPTVITTLLPQTTGIDARFTPSIAGENSRLKDRLSSERQMKESLLVEKEASEKKFVALRREVELLRQEVLDARLQKAEVEEKVRGVDEERKVLEERRKSLMEEEAMLEERRKALVEADESLKVRESGVVEVEAKAEERVKKEEERQEAMLQKILTMEQASLRRIERKTKVWEEKKEEEERLLEEKRMQEKVHEERLEQRERWSRRRGSKRSGRRPSSTSR